MFVIGKALIQLDLYCYAVSMATVGSNFRRIRKEKGVKQEQIYKQLGYKRPANVVPKRLKSMQTSSPLPLKVLAAFPASIAHERRIHYRFKASRVKGEWFKPTKELTAFIRRVQRGIDPAAELANDSQSVRATYESASIS